jgi:hypothetical protein
MPASPSRTFPVTRRDADPDSRRELEERQRRDVARGYFTAVDALRD